MNLKNSTTYKSFADQHGNESGVDFKIAKTSGIPLDDFKPVKEVGNITGTLVLKVWGKTILWAYLETDSEAFAIPVFRNSLSPEEDYFGLKHITLGTQVTVTVSRSKRTGRFYCTSIERL